MSKPILLPSRSYPIGRFFFILLIALLAIPIQAEEASTAADLSIQAANRLQNFYFQLRNQTKECKHRLANGFFNTDDSSGTTSYCANSNKKPSVIWIQGKKGSLSNMDIDCDGIQGGSGDDGRCSVELSPDYQAETAFKDTIQSYNVGISDLNSYVHPYVVFGNVGSKKGWKKFDPEKYGMKPLSVMAVLCGGGKIVWGVWGDINGDDGDKPVVGEVSIALGTACYGERNITGGNGYDGEDVLYLGFTGDEAVPGGGGANWTAGDFEGFEKSIRGLGERMVLKMLSEDSGGRERGVGVGMAVGVVVLLAGWMVL
ncbi:fungal chitosanase of glycosyl hydrolase group 75-domain-containing protein [Podospora fimiseda]|uniref:Endo-chitosanase n=1 Tax=Podospora fimiseda TaxID=252190 RepID=A0AAN7BYK7_9PEZI|nr:fungal chitosanase of glycosyl hydrolase group 75-domain-containing protein [Podospora fimiseda]